MGFVALVSPDDEADFDVLQCHVNLWCLTHYWRRQFVCDVGARLRVHSGKLNSIRIVTPFAVDGDPIDLREKLEVQGLRELVFGEPLVYESDAGEDPVLTLSSGKMRLVRVNGSGATATSIASVDLLTNLQRSRRAPLLWSLPFAHPLDKLDVDHYFRLRFLLGSTNEVWGWKRAAWGRDGALVDLRVLDVRETTSLPGYELESAIKPIAELNTFVIAPSHLQLQARSPELRHARLLESEQWDEYLDRPATHPRRKSIVYYWRQLPEDDKLDDHHKSLKREVEGDLHIPDDQFAVTDTDPFRAFLDLNRHPGLAPWGDHLRTLVLVILALFVARDLLKLTNEIDLPSIPFSNILSILGLTSVVAVVGAYLFVRKRFLDWVSRMRVAFRAFERRQLGGRLRRP
jgi:hypothetical protein